MENAIDALYIGVAVLIFVVALSVSINAFGNARATSQAVLDMKDREYDYTYIQGDSTERIVGCETIVPSIYKAYKEHYKIVFNFKNAEDYLYKKGDEKINYIDLEQEVLGVNQEKFINALLYGNKCEDFNEIKREFKNNGQNIELQENGLYGYITNKNAKFKEELGVYIYEETKTTLLEDLQEKNKKRVITYSEI